VTLSNHGSLFRRRQPLLPLHPRRTLPATDPRRPRLRCRQDHVPSPLPLQLPLPPGNSPPTPQHHQVQIRFSSQLPRRVFPPHPCLRRATRGTQPRRRHRVPPCRPMLRPKPCPLRRPRRPQAPVRNPGRREEDREHGEARIRYEEPPQGHGIPHGDGSVGKKNATVAKH